MYQFIVTFTVLYQHIMKRGQYSTWRDLEISLICIFHPYSAQILQRLYVITIEQFENNLLNRNVFYFIYVNMTQIKYYKNG